MQIFPKPQINNTPINSVGAVAKLTSKHHPVQLKPFSVRLYNSALESVYFIIGDPTNIILNALPSIISAKTYNPTSASSLVAGMKASFGVAPIAVKAINYKTPRQASQLNSLFEVVTADIDGNLKRESIDIAAYLRNNQFNDKLMTFEFTPGNEFIFAWNTALLVEVIPEETVYLSFTPAAAANRF